MISQEIVDFIRAKPAFKELVAKYGISDMDPALQHQVIMLFAEMHTRDSSLFDKAEGSLTDGEAGYRISTPASGVFYWNFEATSRADAAMKVLSAWMNGKLENVLRYDSEYIEEDEITAQNLKWSLEEIEEW